MCKRIDIKLRNIFVSLIDENIVVKKSMRLIFIHIGESLCNKKNLRISDWALALLLFSNMGVLFQEAGDTVSQRAGAEYAT